MKPILTLFVLLVVLVLLLGCNEDVIAPVFNEPPPPVKEECVGDDCPC